jgi:hypothetical protein
MVAQKDVLEKTDKGISANGQNSEKKRKLDCVIRIGLEGAIILGYTHVASQLANREWNVHLISDVLRENNWPKALEDADGCPKGVLMADIDWIFTVKRIDLRKCTFF